MVQAHDTGPSGVTIDELVMRMTPAIDVLLANLEGEEFTSAEFIELMQQFPPTKAVYDEAMRAWGEAKRPSRMVIHGQVIPAVLRKSDRVEWLGFAYGEADDYAVPGRWRLLPERGR